MVDITDLAAGDESGGEAARSDPSEVSNSLDPYERLFGRWVTGSDSLQSKIQREQNVRHVADLASTKISDGQGAIPPRVAASVIDSAQWADDEHLARYLAGVLASARSISGVDDRALAWANLIGRLPSDQLRLHYGIYASLRSLVRGHEVAGFAEWTKRTMIVDYTELFRALGWNLVTTDDIVRVLDAAYGLQREGLLDDLSHGSGDYLRTEVLRTKGRDIEAGGYLIWQPSADGIGLFLQAHGLGGRWLTQLASDQADFTLPHDSDDLPMTPTCRFVDEIPLVGQG